MFTFTCACIKWIWFFAEYLFNFFFVYFIQIWFDHMYLCMCICSFSVFHGMHMYKQTLWFVIPNFWIDEADEKTTFENHIEQKIHQRCSSYLFFNFFSLCAISSSFFCLETFRWISFRCGTWLSNEKRTYKSRPVRKAVFFRLFLNWEIDRYCPCQSYVFLMERHWVIASQIIRPLVDIFFNVRFIRAQRSDLVLPYIHTY